MALWTGIVGEANTKAAMAFNTVLTQRVVIGLAKHRPFFRMLFGGVPRAAGNQAVGGFADGMLRFEKINYVKGNQYEMQMLGRLDDFTFLQDGNDEVALVGASVNTDDVARFTWDLSHFFKKEWITGSEMSQIRNDKVKSEQLVDFKLRKLGEEFARFVNTRLFGNTNQSRASIGGLDYIINTNNVYGADRSSAGNEFLKGYKAAFTGNALNLDDITLAQNTVASANGDAECGFVGTTVFGYLQHELREHQTVMVTSDLETDSFGATNINRVRFGPTWFYHDTDCGNKRLYILSFGRGDLPYWKVVMGDDPMISTGVIADKVNRPSANVIPVEGWFGLFCAHCPAQAKLTHGTETSDIGAPSAWAA